MNKKYIYCFFLAFMILLNSRIINAQDLRNQYPSVLSKAYFEVNIGYIVYPFSDASMIPGYHVASVSTPHEAVRLTLFGFYFNDYISAQIDYMRPVRWVMFKDVTGDPPGSEHSVWMSYGSLTFKGQYPVYKRISLFAEAGLGIVTRHGFGAPQQIVTNINYATYMLGGGFKYRINNKFDLNLSTVYYPSSSTERQPYTMFHSLGFTYNMQPLSPEKVNDKQKDGYVFPHHLLQIGFSSNVFDYGVNNVFTEGPVPVFWSGNVFIKNGVSIAYQQNIYHTRKVFSLDWGANASLWQSKDNKDMFGTLSLYPLLRFTFLRTKLADIYFNYSAAGPSYISKIYIDNQVTGKHFTFQDFMGLGFYAGAKRQLNAEFKIVHYSNGNIFPYNPGLTIPLTFNFGFTF